MKPQLAILVICQAVISLQTCTRACAQPEPPNALDRTPYFTRGAIYPRGESTTTKRLKEINKTLRQFLDDLRAGPAEAHEGGPVSALPPTGLVPQFGNHHSYFNNLLSVTRTGGSGGTARTSVGRLVVQPPGSMPRTQAPARR